MKLLQVWRFSPQRSSSDTASHGPSTLRGRMNSVSSSELKNTPVLESPSLFSGSVSSGPVWTTMSPSSGRSFPAARSFASFCRFCSSLFRNPPPSLLIGNTRGFPSSSGSRSRFTTGRDFFPPSSVSVSPPAFLQGGQTNCLILLASVVVTFTQRA